MPPDYEPDLYTDATQRTNWAFTIPEGGTLPYVVNIDAHGKTFKSTNDLEINISLGANIEAVK